MISSVSKCLFLTGSPGEVSAELRGLRETEEHGQQSWDHQGQRAGISSIEDGKEKI